MHRSSMPCSCWGTTILTVFGGTFQSRCPSRPHWLDRSRGVGLYCAVSRRLWPVIIGVPGCAWRNLYCCRDPQWYEFGTRHVLFLYPLAALLAAAGLIALAQHSRRWLWIGGALVACHVVSVMAVFPAEMAYGNEAWGGTANTHKVPERLQCGLGAATATRQAMG